jgi:hypothetical protein
MFRLALYEADEGSGEYVVILSEGVDPKENLLPGFHLDQIIDIDGDATEFPTDILLIAK